MYLGAISSFQSMQLYAHWFLYQDVPTPTTRHVHMHRNQGFLDLNT